MYIIKYKALFIGLSVILTLTSLFLVYHFDIKRGIDFTGGTVVDIIYDATTSPALSVADFKSKNITPYKTGENTYRFVSPETYDQAGAYIALLANPDNAHPFKLAQVSTVGPTLGAELTKKAIIALVVVILAILAFIAFSFRAVSRPVASWKYGVIAMVTLLHDIIVPTGVYALLSHYYGAEVDTLFVIALLTIVGISISDKIVVFDRIRENLKGAHGKQSFDDVVGMSLKQTFTRSINTSVTVVLALLALFFFGPSLTKWFTLTLIVGMIVGTYSSIFVASPLLTVWNKGK